MGNFSLEVVSTQSKIDVNRRMNMEIQKWEYKVVRNIPYVEVHEHEPLLNKLGAEGWELAFVIAPGSIADYKMFFKRPAQLPSDIVFTSDLKKTTENNIPGGSA